jgi:hypothetical protein
MNTRYNRAIGAFILGIGLLTGCIFDSRKPHEDPQRYVTIGDASHIPMELDFVPTLVDSGLNLVWINVGLGSSMGHLLEQTHLDSSGAFVGSSKLDYGDTLFITSPRVSVYGLHGQITVWIRNFSGGTPNEVEVQLGNGFHPGVFPMYPIDAGIRIARHVTTLALPGDEYLLGIEGTTDTARTESLWLQRYDALRKPKGEPWQLSGLPASSAPELVLMPTGGWTAIWTHSGTDSGRIVWQRFDSEGQPAGATGTRQLPGGSSPETTIRADALPDGRILIQARSGSFVPFLIGADGVPEADWLNAGDWQGATLVPDTLRHRFYGLRQGKLSRLDTAFQVQATLSLPVSLTWPPNLAVMPGGKLVLLGHRDMSRPIEERRALLVYTVDPF